MQWSVALITVVEREGDCTFGQFSPGAVGESSESIESCLAKSRRYFLQDWNRGEGVWGRDLECGKLIVMGLVFAARCAATFLVDPGGAPRVTRAIDAVGESYRYPRHSR